MILTPKLLVAITASEGTTLLSLRREELHGDISAAEMNNLSLRSHHFLVGEDPSSSPTLLEHRPLALGYMTPASCKVVVGYESRIVVCEAAHGTTTACCSDEVITTSRVFVVAGRDENKITYMATDVNSEMLVYSYPDEVVVHNLRTNFVVHNITNLAAG